MCVFKLFNLWQCSNSKRHVRCIKRHLRIASRTSSIFILFAKSCIERYFKLDYAFVCVASMKGETFVWLKKLYPPRRVRMAVPGPWEVPKFEIQTYNKLIC